MRYSTNPPDDAAARCPKNVLQDVSIIIPVAPDEEAWSRLLGDLAAAAVGAEIILAGAAEQPAEFGRVAEQGGMTGRLRWVRAERGRALQMNTAARSAGGQFLWFLHADSRVAPAAVAALGAALQAAPVALHYFDLAFLNDGPRRCVLNAFGARLRSRVFGLPFGDQGFCIRRDLFEALGGYDETARYGEDHLLVWAARRQGLRPRPVGERLLTSARKYGRGGWGRTTARHLVLTLRQAVPQALGLAKEQLFHRHRPVPHSRLD